MAKVNNAPKTSKNQTATERAETRAREGLQKSGHFCQDPSCPSKNEPILVKDLRPVRVVPLKGKAKTVFYHAGCFKM